jgi:hypothetical protein
MLSGIWAHVKTWAYFLIADKLRTAMNVIFLRPGLLFKGWVALCALRMRPLPDFCLALTILRSRGMPLAAQFWNGNIDLLRARYFYICLLVKRGLS